MAARDLAILPDRRSDDSTLPFDDRVVVESHEPAVLEVIDRQLGEVICRKIGEPLVRAGLAARVLADHVGGQHVTASESVLLAIGAAQEMLQDLSEFWQAGVAAAATPARRRTNLRSLCERVLDSLQDRYPTYGLEFEADACADGMWDADQIASLVARLVVNGVQHGPVGGAVRVRLWGLDEHAVLSVRSAAPLAFDLPAHRLFEPFANARPRKSDGETGLGLGLYLTDRIARAHRGRIDVKSNPVDGTTVRVLLPRS